MFVFGFATNLEQYMNLTARKTSQTQRDINYFTVASYLGAQQIKKLRISFLIKGQYATHNSEGSYTPIKVRVCSVWLLSTFSKFNKINIIFM